MKHIRQRNQIDCGLAVCAMLAGRSYSDAQRADPFPTKRLGLSTTDFMAVLERLETKAHISKPSQRKPLADTEAFHGAAIIREHGRKYGHWIALEKIEAGPWAPMKIHDPESECPERLAEYGRRQWEVIRIVRL